MSEIRIAPIALQPRDRIRVNGKTYRVESTRLVAGGNVAIRTRHTELVVRGDQAVELVG